MPERIRTLIGGMKNSVPARVLHAYGESQASNYALAIAFAGFMSMFPMILGALSIIGFAIRDPDTELRFQLFVLQVFPSSAQPELQKALHGVRESVGWLAVVSVAGLFWSSGSFFSALEFALARIFGTRPRNLLHQRLTGLLMMLLLVVAIVLTVGLNTISSFVPVAAAASVTGFVCCSVVMVSLLVALYRVVPNRRFRIREVMPGALLAGVLIEILSLAFPIYARIAGGFNTYGAQFALFFLLATWFYLLSQLILLGAVYNRFHLEDAAASGRTARSAA